MPPTPILLFQNPSKASQSSRDTLSSGVHSWGSQAEARSSSWNMVLARGRPTDTPSYFNGTAPSCSAPPAPDPPGPGEPGSFVSLPLAHGSWHPELEALGIKSV